MPLSRQQAGLPASVVSVRDYSPGNLLGESPVRDHSNLHSPVECLSVETSVLLESHSSAYLLQLERWGQPKCDGASVGLDKWRSLRQSLPVLLRLPQYQSVKQQMGLNWASVKRMEQGMR